MRSFLLCAVLWSMLAVAETDVNDQIIVHHAFAPRDAVKPHILLVILDDVGRADTGVYGRSNIPLPHLEGLAREGVVLENFYTQTVCSPTRSALMTAQYPFRFGMQHFTTQLPGMIAGVPLDRQMIPSLLKEEGYERHMVGKVRLSWSIVRN